MTKEELKYLNRLAKDIIEIYMREHFFDTDVTSDRYKTALAMMKAEGERHIRQREKGFITHSEAVMLLCNMD